MALELGSKRELFIDTYLVDHLSATASLRLAKPQRQADALLMDRPWEGKFSNYVTVLADGGKFHLYYRGIPQAGADGSAIEVTCYAVSADGHRFERPDLGLFEVHGTRKNNCILAGMPPFSSNFCPMVDTKPGVDPEHRFKALAGTRKSGLVAFVSADGIRWKKLREEPVFRDGVFDSQNLAFWSEAEQCYTMYFRTFKPIGGQRYRWVSRTTSTDFVNWTAPVDMTFGDAPPEHLYVSQTHPYFRAPHIYIALAARFMPGRQVLSNDDAAALGVDPGYFKDCADAVLITSRGGSSYDRTFLEGFLRPGLGLENWVSRNNYPALNTVQTGPEEISFYTLSNYGQPGTHLRRYSLGLDRFASVHADYQGGELITKPLRFEGNRLLLNYATSAAGGVRVELQEESGVAIRGFRMDECVETIGDQTERAVRWTGGGSLDALRGKTLRVRIALRDADVFGLRFG